MYARARGSPIEAPAVGFRDTDKRMLVTIKKYKFHTTKTEFYRFIMELEKLSINPKKIKAIVN